VLPAWYAPCTKKAANVAEGFSRKTPYSKEAFMGSRPAMFVLLAAVASLFGCAGVAHRMCTTEPVALGERSENVTVPQRADLRSR
jgi:hypothetical protein